MKNNILSSYQLRKRAIAKLWLTNYDFGEPLRDITEWVLFQSLDEFANNLVMSKKVMNEEDNYFRFHLDLSIDEENALREFLSGRKNLVIGHILKRKSFSPYTHLYQ